MRDSLVPDHGVGDVLHEELYEVVAGILNLVPLFGHHDRECLVDNGLPLIVRWP
jgi:hypothetical protein